jgi:chromosome segregation protein
MRLRAIKLSGFKSFVDPTTVSFPSNLCAIVGPNGCGKSNIIDAIRWVLGESSAKNLRGASMTDVIFNGSNTRKPVGQASIELLFDDAEGTLSGEFNRYNDLSIQRKVSRDGTSQYLLNGHKCRRKDITDAFLGTGLGPRSYSIIEQGMISQLIDAKPEELRVYLEEAAGISKYKERRRETERRIARTKDNLERLMDLREELDRQIHHLQRQARAAERYKTLKQEERFARAQLYAVRWVELNDQVLSREQEIGRLQVEQDAVTAEMRGIDAGIEKQRELHAELSDNSDLVQKRYYDLGTEIARIEESIQYQQERASQLDEDLLQVKENWQKVDSDLDADQRKIEELSAQLENVEPGLQAAQSKEQLAVSALTEAEENMHQWQLRWDRFNDGAAESRQLAEVEQSRISHLDQSIDRLNDRLQVLDQESQRLQQVMIEEEIVPLEERLAGITGELQGSQARVDDLVNEIASQRENNNLLSHHLDELRSRLQSLIGRRASLEALQQAALGQQDDLGVTWLEKHALADAKRLAEALRVDDGWDLAVETVLGDHLQAVCIEDIDAVANLLADFEKGALGFLETSVETAPPPGESRLLSSRVHCDWDITPWLNGVYVSSNLDEALRLRSRLAPHESVITKEGVWIGSNWLRLAMQNDASTGVIKRQQELLQLQDEISLIEKQVAEAVANLASGNEQLVELESRREETQRIVVQQQKVEGEVQSRLSACRVQAEQLKVDRARTDKEIAESGVQVEQDRHDLSVSRQSWQHALNSMEADALQREELVKERDQNRVVLDQARLTARNDRDATHHLALQKQSVTAQLDSTTQAVERLTSQLHVLQNRRAAIQTAIEESDSPRNDLQRDLQVQLDGRLAVEQELTKVRQSVEEIAHKLRELEHDRANTEEKSQQAGENLNRVRMDWQGLEVRRGTVKEQLEEDFQLQETVDSLPEDADEDSLDEQLVRVGKRLHRLGPINLAAIEEYKVQSERKQYLDAQNEDLEEALEILQNAIRKIDRETRTRFKETFDSVNNKLQQLFPKLFGGGHAYLEMTGEDLLDTGVGLLARPPGKRITSIQSLSGGEKALAAIALIFAIFSLNPAPFCLLDEVDAPLDDTNTGRYSDLVKEMSRTVQFVYITHNKIAMEMAHQMMGVTMHEAGVSRLVSVDMDEAVALATV